jgi:MFS transporter, OFA family, oxalate/formate antiporter
VPRPMMGPQEARVGIWDDFPYPAAIRAFLAMRTFFLGGLADRMGRRLALVTTFVGMALALLVWAFSRDFWPLVAFALAYGVFYGGWVAVLPAVVMDFFGGRNVSGIIGILYTSVAFGTLIGPSAAGFAFDLTRAHATDLASVCANIIAGGIVAGTSKAP